MKTSDMLGVLQRTSDFSRFARRFEGDFGGPSAGEALCALSEKNGVDKALAIARSGIEKGYGYQVFSGRRTPSRDKLLGLAFGLDASLEDAQRLLRAAEKRELYPKIKRDAAVIFCLQKKLSLDDCQTLLIKAGEAALDV